MRFRGLAWGAALIWLGVLLASLLLAASAQARSVANPYSGQWATDLGSGTTGTVRFSLIDASIGASQIQAMHGSPCTAPTTYYHGDYTDTGGGGESGTMTACTLSSGDLLGRYENSNTSLTYPGGDLDIAVNAAQDTFSGHYTCDDPACGGMTFPYSGTFQSDFQGDGCCTTTTTTTTSTTSSTGAGNFGFTLRPPRRFCTEATPHAADPVAHAATLSCEGRDYIGFDYLDSHDQAKTEAKAYLRQALRAVVVVCGLAVVKANHLDEGETVAGLLYLAFCRQMVEELGPALAAVKDPPAANFRTLSSVGSGAPAADQTRGCPPNLSAPACTALLSARDNFVAAASAVASAQEALAQGANRFAGAVKANQPAAAYLQGSAGKIYAGFLVYRLQQQQAAGQALAHQLGADQLGTSLSGRQVKSLRSKVAGKELSKQMLGQLVSDGVAKNRAQARKMLTRQLAGVSGPLDVSALGAAPEVSALSKHYLTISMSELDAVVNGLRDQGDMTSSAAQTLTNDLANAQGSCSNASQRIAAINQFVSDATSLTTGTTATFLVVGALPLKATTLPSSSCQ